MRVNLNELEDAKEKAAKTYNAASDFYDHPANTFWERYGRRTVEHLKLARGERVLDVCCGSGASAIPAAEIVGPDGAIVGVDLAENLLELARAKATERGLTNIQFQSGDLTRLPFEDDSFDAVVCVFGIFFVPDMEAALRELKRVVRKSGRVAITTWGPRFFEPASTAFWNSIREVRPDLYKAFNPWDRISEVDAVVELLGRAGLSDATAVAESDGQIVNGPEDWWAMIMGSGIVAQLNNSRLRNAIAYAAPTSILFNTLRSEIWKPMLYTQRRCVGRCGEHESSKEKLPQHSQPFLTHHASETRQFPVLSRLQKHQSLAKPRQRKAPVRRSIMKKTFRLLLSTLLLVSLSTPLLADTIRLKDGSVIRGQVIGFKDQQFTILIGGNAKGRRGQTTVYVEDVESIEFDSNNGNASATDESSVRNNVPLSRPSTPNNTPPDTNTSDRTNNTPPVMSSNPTFFTIKVGVKADNSNNGWTNSGLVVRKGQRLRISASGRVSLGRGRFATPGGLTTIQDNDKLMRNEATGALIAVIGDDNDDFLLIGPRREFVAQRDGVLFLGVNEGDLADNTGSYDIVIEAEASGR